MHWCTQFKWSKNFHLTEFDGKPYTSDIHRDVLCLCTLLNNRHYNVQILVLGVCDIYVAHVSVATNAHRIQFTCTKCNLHTSLVTSN